eukprot:504955-Pyramimonas_sp.AAC.1
MNESSRSSAQKWANPEGGNMADTEKEVRTKQVVAFGFNGNATAEMVVAELEKTLQQLLSNQSDAAVLPTVSTRYGVIEFPSIQSKVKFWRK